MKKKEKKKINPKLFAILSCVLLALLGGIGYLFYRQADLEPITTKEFWVYINQEKSFQTLSDTLEVHLDQDAFDIFSLLAEKKELETRLHPGAYFIPKETTAVGLYKILSRGLQKPIRVSFNNIRTPEQFAQQISQQLMLDSAEIMSIFEDKVYCEQSGLTREQLPALFLPDTYDFYWNTSVKHFFNQMLKSYQHFWNSQRQHKLAQFKLQPHELTIIASIAEEETNDPLERGIVGRLYINRYLRKIPLQADPTVKFAVGDFSLRRILFEHLKIDSPYNTYKYAGIPPGPIRFPEKATIDAILNSAPHDYIFMCAKEDFSGLHNFAKTYRGHINNANKYRQALNNKGIR